MNRGFSWLKMYFCIACKQQYMKQKLLKYIETCEQQMATHATWEMLWPSFHVQKVHACIAYRVSSADTMLIIHSSLLTACKEISFSWSPICFVKYPFGLSFNCLITALFLEFHSFTQSVSLFSKLRVIHPGNYSFVFSYACHVLQREFLCTRS